MSSYPRTCLGGPWQAPSRELGEYLTTQEWGRGQPWQKLSRLLTPFLLVSFQFRVPARR